MVRKFLPNDRKSFDYEDRSSYRVGEEEHL